MWLKGVDLRKGNQRRLTYSTKIELLHAQNLLIILGVEIAQKSIGEIYMFEKVKKIFTLLMIKDFV